MSVRLAAASIACIPEIGSDAAGYAEGTRRVHNAQAKRRAQITCVLHELAHQHGPARPHEPGNAAERPYWIRLVDEYGAEMRGIEWSVAGERRGIEVMNIRWLGRSRGVLARR